MALTEALLRANAGLATLTDEQVQAIVELSRNDENTVIGTKIGELHGRYDADVLAITGLEKNQGEKSYDYVKRILGDYKQKAETSQSLNTTITSLKEEIEGYKKTIAEGKGNEEIAKQLKDAQKQLADTKNLLEAKNNDWQDKYNVLSKQYQDSLVDAEFNQALSAIKIKSVYPESVQQTLIDAAKRTVLAKAKPEWVESDGKKSLVFRDASGEIMTNKQNKLNPFTAGELLLDELKDVIEVNPKKTGTGTNNHQGGGSQTLDLTGITNQVDADEAISKHLMQNGYTRGSQEFSSKAQELRRENQVEKLPIQ